MNTHINDSGVCYACCGAINNITTCIDTLIIYLVYTFLLVADQASACEAGAIESILKAMNQNISDYKICKLGCGVLNNIVSGSK